MHTNHTKERISMRKFGYGLYLVLVSALVLVIGADMFGARTALLSLMGFKLGVAGGVLMAMAVAPFPTDAALTSIAALYKPGKKIADQVMRRIMVPKQEFSYLVFDKRTTTTIPDTRVGRGSEPNAVDFGATETESKCVGQGLESFVPQADIDNAGENYNPLAVATEGIMELVALDREKRVADLVFNTASYAATTNRTQLSGNHYWNGTHADGNPIPDILTGLDNCPMRPNTMVLGPAAWSGLRTNAYVLKAVNRNSGDSGMASREAVAALFELDEILVGEGWYNTAKKGQTASMSRLWGKHCSLLYLNKTPIAGQVPTFGWTAQWGQKVAAKEYLPRRGLTGGTMVWAGEYVKEVVTATDLGYYIEDCVS